MVISMDIHTILIPTDPLHRSHNPFRYHPADPLFININRYHHDFILLLL